MKDTITPQIIWSNTDYPYICLIDKKRTQFFKKAIDSIVKNNDHVLEIGAGTGILSLFAEKAGASNVTGVEIDPVLIKYLNKTIKLNKLSKKIKIVAGNSMDVELPKNVDVVIAELIETGLLDEMQVTVINNLHERKIINDRTKIIPAMYETYIQFVNINSLYYGLPIATPKHDWPYYSEDINNWEQLNVEPVSKKLKLNTVNFYDNYTNPKFSKKFSVQLDKNKSANAIRITGKAYLTEKIIVYACNSFNGDKIINLDQEYSGKLDVNVNFVMGAGLDNFNVKINSV